MTDFRYSPGLHRPLAEQHLLPTSRQDPWGTPRDPQRHGLKNGNGKRRREAPLKRHRMPTTSSVSSDAEGGGGWEPARLSDEANYNC